MELLSSFAAIGMMSEEELRPFIGPPPALSPGILDKAFRGKLC